MSARVWWLLMHVARRLHSLACRLFWFSLVCWGFVQGYLHRGCLCKRETRTEAELVERVEVAGALSIPVFGDILSGMFLVAATYERGVCTWCKACFGMVLPQMLFVLTISCLWAFAEPHFPIRS